MVKRLLVLSTLLLFTAGANAGIVVALESKTPTGTGEFSWVYDVTLENNSLMSQNNFFVVYDIPGTPTWDPNTVDSDSINTGVPDLTGWSVSQPASGPVPSFLHPNDNNSLSNVLVTLTDNTTIVPRPKDVDGLLLGKLTVISPIGIEGTIDFTSQSAQLSGSGVNVLGSVAGPIPEPSTVGIMGAGLVAAMALALRRRRR